MSEILSYTVVLGRQQESGFTVTVPALPEVVTEGDTVREALVMAEDPVRAILAYRRDHRLPIPDDAMPIIRKITVAV